MNCKIYPSYQAINKAKLECQPNSYKSSKVEVVIPLQDLLNKTGERLCEGIALEWNESVLSDLQLIGTSGFVVHLDI